jgi:ABC-type bacteriocin/lantibiotic exporter with double-glycine peptidase domain
MPHPSLVSMCTRRGMALGIGFLLAFTTVCTISSLRHAALATILGGQYLDDVDVIHHRSRNDCGVAALEMVLRRFGRDETDLNSLRILAQRRPSGLSLGDLEDKALALGLESHAWLMTAADLGTAPLPAVVHFPGHFLVLDSLGRGGWVYLRDPSNGRIRMTAVSFRRHWSGRILLFDPTP